MVKSPVLYFGGKHQLAELIAAALPPHKHYVEVCAGSLSVLLAKRPSQQETMNDLDGRITTFWRVLRDRAEELERVCVLTPHSRAERELATEFPPGLDELETARRVFIALTQGRTSTLKNTGWRFNTAAVSTPMPIRLRRYAGRLAPAAKRLAEVSIECRPAVEMVRAYGGDRKNLLYVDPPYNAVRAKNYSVEMSLAEHRALAKECLSVDAAIVVSGYRGGVWGEVLTDWHQYEISASTTQGTGLRDRVEVLWSNRALMLPDAVVSSRTTAIGDETRTRCPACTAIVRQPKTGRRKVWCSAACRTAGYRAK